MSGGHSRRVYFYLWLLTVAALMGSANFLAVAQQNAATTPQIMPISLSKPKPNGQTGLKRPYGDGNTWVFQIAPDPNIRWVEGPIWHYAGSVGNDPQWGTWGGGNIGDFSLSWISPLDCGAFNIRVTGKIVGTGPGGNGGGAGKPIDVEASWDGAVASPPPPVELCDGSIIGETDCTTCGCPDGINQQICFNTNPFFLYPSFGPPVALQMVLNSTTGQWSDNYNKKAIIGPDGKVKVTSPGGREDTFAADGTGEPGDSRTSVKKADGSVEIVNPDGSKEVYLPDGNGGLILSSQKDAAGNAITMARDAAGKLTKVTAADGQEMTVARNAGGRISQVASGVSAGVSYGYDAGGNLSSTTDELGRTTSYQYDAQGRITQITTPLGVTKYTYEGGDGVGVTGYSAPGQPMGFAKRTTIEYPDGSKEETFWDGFGNSWHVAPEHYIAYVDATTNNSSADVPKTITKIETIAGEGKVTEETDPLGNKTLYQYDAVSGLLLQVTDALGHAASTTYNSKGNPLVVTDADGKTTTFEYGANGEDVTKIKDAQGNASASFTYDASHNVLTATGADGKTTTYTYTAWGHSSNFLI